MTTINTPLPVRIDEPTLLACLKAKTPEPKWRVHVQAFFDEIDVSVIHQLVLDKAVTFEDLSRAIDIWHVAGAENERWVREMAAFEMARPHAEGAARAR
ncbi:hypothetical protein [Bradyrhizobium sp. USDA 4353]